MAIISREAVERRYNLIRFSQGYAVDLQTFPMGHEPSLANIAVVWKTIGRLLPI